MTRNTQVKDVMQMLRSQCASVLATARADRGTQALALWTSDGLWRSVRRPMFVKVVRAAMRAGVLTAQTRVCTLPPAASLRAVLFLLDADADAMTTVTAMMAPFGIDPVTETRAFPVLCMLLVLFYAKLQPHERPSADAADATATDYIAVGARLRAALQVFLDNEFDAAAATLRPLPSVPPDAAFAAVRALAQRIQPAASAEQIDNQVRLWL